MLEFINIEFRTFIFIVEFNTKFAQSIAGDIDTPRRATVQSFPTGEVFIKHLLGLRFRRNDLVIVFLGYNFLSDYKNSLMNGIEILEAIKRINPKFEVVMMADEGESEYGAYVMKLGAHAFIPKDDNIATRANNIILRLCGNRDVTSKKRLLRIALIAWLATLVALIISIALSL